PRLSRGVGAGAARWLTMHTYDDSRGALQALRDGGYLIAATTLNPTGDTVPLDSLKTDKRLCLVFGNEHAGVSPFILEEADLQVQIPMVGFVESLNVSVAFAVAMYQLRRELNAQSRDTWALSEAEQVALLDRWVVSDIGRSEAILMEMARRLA
ncbi:MAG: TrmH family RNA methyltransferase, partial [Myxococcota bacterium]|nr:TrmH family RNA methyltransferase [Myxococcota bacterium]